MVTNIKGTQEHLEQLVKELEDEGIKVENEHNKIKHITLWHGFYEVECFCHTQDNIKLNANLPSHRKHFVNKAKKMILQ